MSSIRIKELKGLSKRDLFYFSIPTIFASILEPIAGLIDTALVGQLSTLWLGSLAIAVTLFNSLTWMFNFLVHASTQTVSDHKAQSNPETLVSRIKVCLWVAFGVGLLTSFCLWFFKTPLYYLIGAKVELFSTIDQYYNIRVGGHLFTIFYTTLISLLRGFGRVRVCFFILGTTTALNIFLTWGLLNIFDTGLAGAAYGTVGANFMGCLLCFILLFKESSIKKYFFITRIKKDQWFHFGKNSFDLFGRSAILTISFFLAARFASDLGVEVLGAHQVLLQLWLFMSFFQDGLAITGNILGARYFSENRIEETKVIFLRLLELGGLIGIVFTLTYLIFREPLLSLFTQDSLVLDQCRRVWPLIWLSQIISGVAFVYDGLIFGLEGFSFLRKHMFIGFIIIFLPLVVSSLFWGGLVSIWLGLVLLNAYRGVSGYYFVRSKLSLRGVVTT